MAAGIGALSRFPLAPGRLVVYPRFSIVATIPSSETAFPQPIDPPRYWNRACRELSDGDPVLRRLIETHRREVLRGSGDAFQTIVNAVVGQQISVAAAAGISGRLAEAFPDCTAAALAAAEPSALREVGLSARKAEYIVGIAEAFADGRIDPATWRTLGDAEVHASLTALRGVGPWTADMMLIFHAHRPDVLPLGDLGLVNTAARLYGWEHEKPVGRQELLGSHAEKWRPWRTVATWYIWCDLDSDPVIY